MKKMIRGIAVIIGFLLVMIISFVIVKQYEVHDAPYPDIKASADTAVIARGKYLVTVMAHCGNCHEGTGQNKLGDEISFSGGRQFKLPIGVISAPNLTSDSATGLGKLSDAEIARTLRYGIGHDGRVLVPFMSFQDLGDTDLCAIVSYLRTLPAEKNKVNIRNFNVLGYIANALLIKPTGPSAPPAKDVKRDTTAAYGQYLATNVSGCRSCHTNRDLKSGAFIGPQFAGGFHMESDVDPEHYECITPNLTPDNTTGVMTGWSKQAFINRIRAGKLIAHSPMPWQFFKKMDNNDLTAIYNFLKTLKPVNNKVPVTIAKLKN